MNLEQTQQNTENNITPINTPNSAPSQANNKIGKFAASTLLVKESFALLKQDKELMWFPVLSVITSLFVLIIFSALFFFIVVQGGVSLFEGSNEEQLNMLGYGITFLYYLVMFCISNYFIAGIYTIVNGRFNGQNLSFLDGIKNANKHFEKIFVWSLISATVGVILRIISDNSKIIGKIVASLFGAAWAILTYFSLPALVISERSIKDSFKESASAIRKTWGEAIIVNFGIGLFFFTITFIGVVFMVTTAILVPDIIMLILLGILFIFFITIISVIYSTLSSIIKLALYSYAITGIVPQGFTPELIQNTIKSKNNI
jgi:hypothetical protein